MSVFQRIHWEDWQLILAVIALVLIFSVFILVVIRILRTPNSKLDHFAKLPFEDEKVSHEKRTKRD